MTDATTTIEPQVSVEPESISDYIAAAYDEVEAATPSEPVRGEDGKFVSTEPPAEAVEAPADKEEKPEASAETKAEEPAIEPPASLGAAARERWGELPREIQESLKASLDESHATVEQRAKEVSSLEAMKGVLEQYKPNFAAKGITEVEAVRRLLAVEASLTEKPVETLQQLARSYGVNLSQLAQQQPQQAAVDPKVAALEAKVAKFEAMFQATNSAKEQDVTQAVEKFSADPANVYFKDVRPAMAALANTYPDLSLKELYDRACRADPVVHGKIEADKARAEAIRRDKAAREAANKAVSLKGSPPPPAGNAAPDSIRSTLEAAFDGRL